MITARVYLTTLDEFSSDNKNKYCIKEIREHFEKNEGKERMKYRRERAIAAFFYVSACSVARNLNCVHVSP